MTEAAPRERFERSLSLTERAIFDQATSSYYGQAYDKGVTLTAEQCERCAAAKIQYMRDHGIAKAARMKLGKVPHGWPDVPEKLTRVKKKRQRRALPGESESEIQSAIIKHLLKQNCLVIRFNSSAQRVGDRYLRAYTIANNGVSSGISDIIVFKGGRLIFMEVMIAKYTWQALACTPNLWVIPMGLECRTLT